MVEWSTLVASGTVAARVAGLVAGLVAGAAAKDEASEPAVRSILVDSSTQKQVRNKP